MKKIKKDFFIFPILLSLISLVFYYLFCYFFELRKIDRIVLFDENSKELMGLPGIFFVEPISIFWDSFFFFIFMIIITSFANFSLKVEAKKIYKILDSDPDITLFSGVLFGVSVGFFIGFSDEFIFGLIAFLLVSLFSIIFFEYGFILGAFSSFGFGLGFGLNFGIGFFSFIFIVLSLFILAGVIYILGIISKIIKITLSRIALYIGGEIFDKGA